MPQVADHRFTDMRMFDLRKLKYQSGGKVRLFISSLAAIKLPSLAVMVGKALRTNAAFPPVSPTAAL